MKSIQQQYGKLLWHEILKNVAIHSEFDIDTTKLGHDSPTSLLFPKDTETGKNRFGQLMFDLFDFVKEVSNFDLQIDYPARSEYENFKELSDIWSYFIGRMEDEQINLKNKKNTVIPFPKKA